MKKESSIYGDVATVPLVIIRKGMKQLLLLSGLCLLLLHCRDIVIRSQAGEFSRGTYTMLLDIYKDEQIERLQKGVSEKEIEQEFLEKLKTYEALGALALDLKIEKNEYFQQFLALQNKSRYSKAAFAYWRQKLGGDFSFSDVFQYYDVKVNPSSAIAAIERFRAGGSTEKTTILGSWKRGDITLADLRLAVTTLEYKTFLGLDSKPLKDALPEKIRSFLAKVAHDEMRHNYRAYESELQRWDLSQVADKFVRVKYGIAGKGIYPDEPIEVPVSMEEIYDVYHANLNRYARLQAVLVEEYFCFSKEEAEALIPQLLQATFPKPSRIRYVQAYNNPDDFREKERRSDADNAILAAAYKNVRVSNPYPYGKGYAVAYMKTFQRAEEPSVEKYSSKIEREIQLNLLRRQYELDLSDKKTALRFATKLPGV